jgi:hypothetical protein
LLREEKVHDRRRDEARLACRLSNLTRSSRHLHRFAPDLEETSVPVASFAITMKLERESVWASDLNAMDRRVIQVDMPPTHAGITAALRRAFEAAATEPCDRDFAELLRRLN